MISYLHCVCIRVWDVPDNGVAEEALGFGCTESLRAEPAD